MCDDNGYNHKKEGDNMSAVAKTEIEEHSPRESLKESLKEMQLMREGKLPKTSIDDFLEEEEAQGE